ncbi:MAG: class I SAM-dependent methyltransferase [Candidatus Parcubacteria bacterium]|nr:class I SAM-dependent methyltransferase [Candidatus Parcubacteria bacterium]
MKEQNKLQSGWHFIAQIEVGDFLSLEDAEEAYMQNYLEDGFTAIKFEPLGKNKYAVYLRRPGAVNYYKDEILNLPRWKYCRDIWAQVEKTGNLKKIKYLQQKDPYFKAFCRVLALSVKIEILKKQLINWQDKQEEIINELDFWGIALKNYRALLQSPAKNKILSDWEVGLPADLRRKFRNRKYLPSYAEASRIPFKQREAYQEKMFDYEIWNREYIKALARVIGKKKQIVLEVGAGTGRLSYFLQKKLPQSKFYSTDVSLKNKVSGISLIKMSMKQALQKFKPDVLICSWPDEFFWQEIKYNQRANKIILIGDSEDTPLAKDVEGEWQWLKIDGFEAKESLKLKEVQTSRDSLGITLIYSK